MELNLKLKARCSFRFLLLREMGIEIVLNFLKMCLWKHVPSELAWDEVTHIACAAYNFVPNMHSKESGILPYIF